MLDAEIRQAMVNIGRSLFDRGYATGGAGNLSALLPNGHVLATPTGSSLGRLEAESLSLVDQDGNHIGGLKPSKEVSFHLAIYRERPQCRAIVHLHSTYLTALSCLDGLDRENALRPFTPYYVMRIGKLPVVPYLKPGDPEISSALGKLARENRAMLLASHGPVVTGSDIVDAADNAEELEETAKLAFLLHGRSIRYLTDDEITALSAGRI